MRKSSFFILALVVTMIAVAAGIYLGIRERAPEPTITATAITRLFATSLNDADGKTQPFAQWQGKTMVINFWATWCPPCREEMPAFSRLQTKHAAKGVQFVGIALDTPENVVDFSRRYPATYPLLIAGSEGTELSRELGNASLALPYTVVLGANGEAQLTRTGFVSEPELDRLLQKVVLP